MATKCKKIMKIVHQERGCMSVRSVRGVRRQKCEECGCEEAEV